MDDSMVANKDGARERRVLKTHSIGSQKFKREREGMVSVVHAEEWCKQMPKGDVRFRKDQVTQSIQWRGPIK